MNRDADNKSIAGKADNVQSTSGAAIHAQLVRRLVGGGAWVLAGRAGGIGLTFFSLAFLARWLSAGEFGQFLLLVNIIGFLGILGRFGLDRMLVRFVAEGVGTNNALLVRRALRLSFSAAFASTLTVSILALTVGFLPILHVSILAVLLLATAVPVFTFLYLAAESFRGFHELRYASLFQPHSGPLTMLIFLGAMFGVFAVTEPSLTGALTCYVLSVAIMLPPALVLLLRMVKEKLPAEERATEDQTSRLDGSRLLFLCAPAGLSDALTFLSANAGLWLVAIFCSTDQLALFGAARQLSMLAALPLNLVNLTVGSTIPELHALGRLPRLQRVLQVTASIAVIPTLFLVFLFAVAPGPILGMVFGAFYREAAQILLILGLAQLVSTWAGSCQNTLLLTGRQNIVAALNLFSVVALFVLGPIIGTFHGAIGIAVVSALVIATTNVVAWLTVRMQFGVWTHATIRWLKRRD